MSNENKEMERKSNVIVGFLKKIGEYILYSIFFSLASLSISWLLALAPAIICYILDLTKIIKCISNIVFGIPIFILVLGFICSFILAILETKDNVSDNRDE